jgi:hypothetical protein
MALLDIQAMGPVRDGNDTRGDSFLSLLACGDSCLSTTLCL